MSELSKQQKDDLDRVKAACRQLGDYFDSVHIFCTRHESGELDGTVNVHWGEGNWFARYGQIRTWLVKQDEDSCGDVRDSRNEEPT